MRISDWSSDVCSSDLLPEFTDSWIHIVTGLLLPIWKRLPDEGCRVYRLQTDDGERVIGRLVSRSEEHTSELQSLMRISYAVFCLKKKKITRECSLTTSP